MLQDNGLEVAGSSTSLLKHYHVTFNATNNYMCKKNCAKNDIIFIGTMYGYFRDMGVLYNQLTKSRRNDIIQVMTHPGFYWKFIKHKTKFSNYDRLKELKVLKDLKKFLNGKSIEYVNYKEGGDYIGK